MKIFSIVLKEHDEMGKKVTAKHHQFNPLTTSVSHQMETSQLICRANQLSSFYMKENIGRQSVNTYENTNELSYPSSHDSGIYYLKMLMLFRDNLCIQETILCGKNNLSVAPCEGTFFCNIRQNLAVFFKLIDIYF